MGAFWRHIQRGWQAGRWLIIGGLWALALLLGYVGFARHPDPLGTGDKLSPLDLFYLTLQLIPMNSGAVPPPVSWELHVGRLLIPAVAAYTAIQALAEIFAEQFRSFRLRRIHDHAIICGLGRKGFLLAKGFLARGEPVVVIELDEDDALIQPCRDLGVDVIIGDATNRETLRRAGVHRARHVIAAGGDDGGNAEVAVKARILSGGRPEHPLTCLVHIVDPQLCNLLRERELAAGDADGFRLEFFNVYDLGAQALLDEYPPFQVTAPDVPPHLLLVGLGSMGRSLVVRAARLWREGQAPVRLRITVVDRDADRKVELLRLRYPRLEGVCELVSCQMDVLWPEFERAGFIYDGDGRCRVSGVYVCLDNDSLGLGAGLTLLKKIRGQGIPIIVRMTGSAGLPTLLTSAGDAFADLHAFPLLDRTCRPDLLLGGTHELLARAIHEDYVQQQTARGETAATNPVLTPWEDLPESVREMNRRQADHVGVKLAAIGCSLGSLTDWDAESFRFTPDEVTRLARLEHERFVADRLREGWTYAPGARNATHKTRPDLAPWEELPEAERRKDRDAVCGLPAFLAKAGLQIHRTKQAGEGA